MIPNRLTTIFSFVRAAGPFALACVGFFVLARIGALAGLTGKTGTPFWAASGFGLALALRGRRADILGLACGSFLAAAWTLDLAPSLVVAVSDTSSACLAAILYRRIQVSLPWLGALRDGLALSLSAIVVALLASASAASVIAWSYALPDAIAQEIRLTWFMGDALGVIIAGPVFVSFLDWARRPGWINRKAVVATVGTVASAVLVAAAIVSFPERKGLIFSVFLVPVWAAYFFGERAVKFAVLVGVVMLLVLTSKFGVNLIPYSPESNRIALVLLIAGFGLSWLVIVSEAAERFRGIPLGVFIVLAFVGARLFGVVEATAQEKINLRTDQVVMAGDNLTRAHSNNFFEALRPALYVLRENQQISSVSWANYVSGLKLAVHYAGMRGMGVVYPVKSENLEDFFAQCRQRGIPLSALGRPLGAGKVLPISVAEHQVLTLWHSQNLLAPIGADITAIDPHRAAMETARDTGEPQLVRFMPGFRNASDKKELRAGLMIFWPVYRTVEAPTTVAGRRGELVCWLTAVFDLTGIEINVLQKIPTPTELSVYAGTEVKPEALIYRNQLPSETRTIAALSRTSSLVVLNRTFTLVWKIHVENESSQYIRLMAAAISIIVMGALLSTLVLNLRGFAHKVERQVVDRTKELQLANLALMNERSETRKLALIAMEAKNPMFLTGGDFKIQWINRSFAEFYGYTIEEVFGKRTKEILTGPESNLGAMGDRRDTFYVKKEPVTYEILHYTKAGANVWVSVSIRPILDPQGEFERVIGVITDLTASKEYQLRLEEATARAEQANQAKSALIANVSHELRTPLNVIMGNLQLLQAGKYGRVEECLRAPLQSIRASSQHLLQLIGDLLDVSKAGAGMLTLKTAPVSVTQLVENAVGMIRPSAEIKNLQLTAALEHRTDLVEGDELRLKQILINLLSNAVKFTREGGTVAVRVEETAQPAELLFHVSDTGAGIHPDDHERIFLEFEQGEHVGHSGGTGLGLPIARRLAVMHGGALTVASEVGHGSTFTVRLPVRLPAVEPAAAPLPPEEPAPTPPAGHPLAPHEALILAVDDFEINLEILCMYLEGEGYQVIRALGGEDAIAQAQERLPNVILMDVKMAGIDGLEAIRRLKAIPQTRDIPVISLTAFASAADTERCLEAGASDYISKPIDFPELGRKITRQLTPRA